MVPQQCVSRNSKGDPFVLVVNGENKAEMRLLVLDRAIKDQWLVEEGLAPGDRVIIEGLMMLRPGTVVNASPFGEKPEAGAPEKKEAGH